MDILKMIMEIFIIFLGIYGVLYYFRGTKGIFVISSILIFGILIKIIAELLNLNVISHILESFGNSFWIILFIIFQSEIRRLLAQLGTIFVRKGQERRELIGEVVMACVEMSHQKCGALIVVERAIKLQNFIDDGTPLDIKVNNLILRSIFFPNSPLHDGGVIIRDDRIVTAGTFFPLTTENVDQNLGTRHRAAKGISDETDAIAIVVSEETGSISMVHKGEFRRDLSGGELEQLLDELFVNNDEKEFKDKAQYIEQKENQ